MKRIGDARFVLPGEATYGTHEFYRERAIVTRRLIEEMGFDTVTIESHYFDARISKQFDAVIHLNVTNAVKSLD